MKTQTVIRRIQSIDEAGSEGAVTLPHKDSFPVDALAGYVGQSLELHYLDAGMPQIETARLLTMPTGHFFYMSYDGINQHIVYWYARHNDGRISGVKRIVHEGQTIYENDDLPFDQGVADEFKIARASSGPSRIMTREYLSGMFG